MCLASHTANPARRRPGWAVPAVWGAWFDGRVELLKPRAVRPGDCIGIVSTSSPVSAAELDQLTGYLKELGYSVKLADGVLDQDGYLAGTARRRAAGVMSMFADPAVAMVLPANGGAGAEHLVDLLDYELIRSHPKVFTGFSNPTALVNSVLAAAGLATVHGVSGFQFYSGAMHEPWTEEAFWGMVSGPIAGREIPGDDWRVHRASGVGAVSGPVIGGNLYSLRHLVGTGWMPPSAGAILLIEQMRGTFESVDSHLTHLRLAGVLDGIAALVVGAPADWPREDAPDASVDELILRCVPDGFPVITNVGFGHQPRKIQFALGCRAEFDLRGERPVLRYLEDLVTT
jgi:muramoyltetrapeptide carboxypeptidase